MVTGIESFKEWFKGNESQYAIIGGTACDILMTEEGLDFRATKDIDLVLIIEAVDAAFGRKFWDYVKQAGYEHCNKSSGMRLIFFCFFEKIVVPILTSGGYVGLSIATLLSQHHQVTAGDIIPEKVDMINNRKSPIRDDYMMNLKKTST